MHLESVTLRFRDDAGAQRAASIAIGAARSAAETETAGVVLAARVESAESSVVRVRIANRGGGPVTLDSAALTIATGLAPGTRAHFFKHGYQSWTPSEVLEVGASESHPRDSVPRLLRLAHQSETARRLDAPEAATSELFTIVESETGERMLAGFTGGASQLTTLTVPAPDRIVARVLLDAVELNPGEERPLEPLMMRSGGRSAAHLAAGWAASLGSSMKARTRARYQRGWCSWYHYFHSISEEAMRANLQRLAALRAEFPIELVQVDDGFQSALGDWTTTNARFPSGLRRLADEIRAAGFEAGIWTAPFLAARDSRLMSEHPQWFIRHPAGEPLRAAYNTNWTSSADGFAYALDPSNPGFLDHLREVFRTLTADFGYSYLKLDFLYAAAAEGLRQDRGLTRAETLRRGLETIREAAGDAAFILGCGCPFGPAIGVLDGMRIGPDVAPYWKNQHPGVGAPSTADAIHAIIARAFMHRQLWLNDPDCLMLRRTETQLSRDEQAALAAAIAGSGGMLLISDDMALLGAEQGEAFRKVATLGSDVDAAAIKEAPRAANLMSAGPIHVLEAAVSDGALTVVVNLGDAPATTSDGVSIGPHAARTARTHRTDRSGG